MSTIQWTDYDERQWTDDDGLQWIDGISSSSSSSSVSSSSSSSSASIGAVVWGHHTSVDEDFSRNFQGNWTGTWDTSGSGDDEIILADCSFSSQFFISERWYLGSVIGVIDIDKYKTGSGPTPLIEYRTSSTGAGITSASWNTYNGISFTCLGWVQIKITH